VARDVHFKLKLTDIRKERRTNSSAAERTIAAVWARERIIARRSSIDSSRAPQPSGNK
jgi:hypothetical protein